MNIPLPSWDLTPLAILALIVLTLLKIWPQLKKLGNDENSSLRGDLMGRIADLESQLKDLREQMDEERAEHAREMQIMRHRLNNESQSLTLLLHLWEAAPEKVTDNIERIKAQRLENEVKIAAEKGAMQK